MTEGIELRAEMEILDLRGRMRSDTFKRNRVQQLKDSGGIRGDYEAQPL
jgi:hypothetical protein